MMSSHTSGEAGSAVRRQWEAPALSVLTFNRTAGTQQAGADDPFVASFTPGTPGGTGPIATKTGTFFDTFGPSPGAPFPSLS